MLSRQQVASPVKRIPVEILGNIFYFASRIDSFGKLHTMPSRGISHAHSPLVLLRVCQEWRQIALATPKLFTQLYILDEESINVPFIILLWLKHSKGAPLEVYINCWDKGRWNAKYGRAVETTLSQLREHLYRVTFLGCSFQLVPHLFPHGTDTSLPQLNRLELLSVPSSSVYTIGHVFAPTITTVVVSSPNYYPYGSLHFGDKLTRFSCARPGGLDQFALLKLLANHPNLEVCQVIYCQRQDVGWEALKKLYPSILLPHLRLLSIEWTCDLGNLSCILERLQTPSLECLQIQPIYATGLLPAISTSLRASSPLKLYKLILGFSCSIVDLSDFQSLLSSIPNLKDLIIYEGCWTEVAIRTLNKRHHEHICPSLIKLEFKSSKLPVYEVMKMVESRALSIDKEQKLQQFIATYVTWQDENNENMEQEVALEALCRQLEIHCPSLDVIAV